jgi:soluble lytic murein transglycosylase-like protein
MGNAADTIVSKYPTRVAQLKKPVLDYLMREHKRLPFNGTDQDLYMAVFRPTARRVSPTTVFSAKVKKDNPGINTPQDYINRVNKTKATAILTNPEWSALKDTAAKLNMSWEPLYKLINFESTWDPEARNEISGARGLIQFMPSTARDMGYKGSIGIMTILLLLGGGYFAAKKLKLL